MFGGNCIFTDVRGRTMLSSPAEVKLIFPSVFDVTLLPLLHLPHLLLLPLPQRSRRIAIFHLPSCCLPRSLGLSFLLHSFSLARLLLLPGCSPLHSASLFLPPLNRGFHRNSIFCFDCASVPVQVCSAGMSVCSSCLPAFLSASRYWNKVIVAFVELAESSDLCCINSLLEFDICCRSNNESTCPLLSEEDSFTIAEQRSSPHRRLCYKFTNSKIHFKQLLSLKVSALSLPNLMDSHSKFRARCVEASTDKAMGVKQVCVRKKVCS